MPTINNRMSEAEMTELKAAIDSLLNDPVHMDEVCKRMQEYLSEIDEREAAYRREQTRLWDIHKHDTYC